MKDEVNVWLESLTYKQLVALRCQSGLITQGRLDSREQLIERLRSNANLIDIYEEHYG
jgi:hypothetical protein